MAKTTTTSGVVHLHFGCFLRYASVQVQLVTYFPCAKAVIVSMERQGYIHADAAILRS
jgi:hypothetical protein